MNKVVKILLSLSFIFLLTACTNSKEISLPDVQDLSKVELSENKKEPVQTITAKDEISELIRQLKTNTADTYKESVSDEPTNIDQYIQIQFYHNNGENNPSVAYLYEDGGKAYIEQPYAGIWELDQTVFDSVNEYLNP